MLNFEALCSLISVTYIFGILNYDDGVNSQVSVCLLQQSVSSCNSMFGSIYSSTQFLIITEFLFFFNSLLQQTSVKMSISMAEEMSLLLFGEDVFNRSHLLLVDLLKKHAQTIKSHSKVIYILIQPICHLLT